MIIVNDKFPLLTLEQFNEIFNSEDGYGDYYHVKPIYKHLPDFGELSDDERSEYKFKNVEEGTYLVGLEIIADYWVNRGFCGSLLTDCGLVIDEAYPIIKKKEHYSTEAMIMISFNHISNSFHDIKVSILPDDK